MKSTIFFICLALFFLPTKNIKAQKHQINKYYGVELLSMVLNSDMHHKDNVLSIKSCTLPINLKFSPETPFNGANYTLVKKDKTLVADFAPDNNNVYDIDEDGEYWLKDGANVIAKINVKYTDPAQLYQVVMVDDKCKEITDFSPQNLNNTKLHAAIKHLKRNKIEPCSNKYVWQLNGKRVFDINNTVFNPGDDVVLGLDGIAQCTKSCYGYAYTAYQVLGKKAPTLSSTGIKTDGSLQVFPNPSSDVLRVNYAQIKRLTILDTQSRILKEIDNTKQEREMKIDISSMPAGLYYLNILTDRELLLRKFFKQ